MANKSKEEMMKALHACSLGDKKEKFGFSCRNCPYNIYAFGAIEYKGTNCNEELMKDALEYLSVQPGNDWLQCKERIPEKEKRGNNDEM